MNLLQQLARKYLFGYDAVDSSSTKRKPSRIHRASEDNVLKTNQRGVMTESARDAARNFSIAAWAIRKHLDYVSTFKFQCQSGDDALDEVIESYIEWYSKPSNCDVAGRHSLSQFVRLCEQHRTVDGDILINFLPDGKLQAIEGERLFTPKESDQNPDRTVQGVLISAMGRHEKYAIHSRIGNGYQFDKWLNAEYAHLHGYFSRFDQVRGVSPLAPAINTLKDVYENFDYALAKSKVSQLFALAFYRESSDATGMVEQTAGTSTESTTGGEDEKGYSVDFGKGPVQLDLDPGDRAEFLESRTPATEFQQFQQMMISVSLKALDIPFSFYDESYTNYSGARQALLQYEQSAAFKRDSNIDLLDKITTFAINRGTKTGAIKLPKNITPESLKFTWQPAGLPWIDPSSEADSYETLVRNGFKSPQAIHAERGTDAMQTLKDIAAFNDRAKSLGVELAYNVPQSGAPAAIDAKAIQDVIQKNAK